MHQYGFVNLQVRMNSNVRIDVHVRIDALVHVHVHVPARACTNASVSNGTRMDRTRAIYILYGLCVLCVLCLLHVLRVLCVLCRCTHRGTFLRARARYVFALDSSLPMSRLQLRKCSIHVRARAAAPAAAYAHHDQHKLSRTEGCAMRNAQCAIRAERPSRVRAMRLPLLTNAFMRVHDARAAYTSAIAFKRVHARLHMHMHIANAHEHAHKQSISAYLHRSNSKRRNT